MHPYHVYKKEYILSSVLGWRKLPGFSGRFRRTPKNIKLFTQFAPTLLHCHPSKPQETPTEHAWLKFLQRLCCDSVIVLNFHHRHPVWCCAGARSPNFIKFLGKNFQVVTADPSKVCCSETGPVVSLGVARCALTVRWSFGACCRIGFW